MSKRFEPEYVEKRYIHALHLSFFSTWTALNLCSLYSHYSLLMIITITSISPPRLITNKSFIDAITHKVIVILLDVLGFSRFLSRLSMKLCVKVFSVQQRDRRLLLTSPMLDYCKPSKIATAVNLSGDYRNPFNDYRQFLSGNSV